MSGCTGSWGAGITDRGGKPPYMGGVAASTVGAGGSGATGAIETESVQTFDDVTPLSWRRLLFFLSDFI